VRVWRTFSRIVPKVKKPQVYIITPGFLFKFSINMDFFKDFSAIKDELKDIFQSSSFSRNKPLVAASANEGVS